MSTKTSTEYTQLQAEEDVTEVSSLADDFDTGLYEKRCPAPPLTARIAGLVSDPRRRGSQSEGVVLRRVLLALRLLLFASVFFALGAFVNHVRSSALDETPVSTLHGIVRFNTIEFNPRFGGPPSEYMGPPTPQLDQLWYTLAGIRNFEVDRSALESLNRSQGAVQFLDSDSYLAGMEVFHQLHCLNYIRMYTYMDHYEKLDYDMIGETLEDRQRHKDHCLEEIRQTLMCKADLNLYSYHWIETREKPWGNLFTRHRCVDWDSFYTWAEENTAQARLPPLKPEGAELSEYGTGA